MLDTQVEYWKLQETKRHNRVGEEQGWANVSLGFGNLEENKRHNLETEALGTADLAERGRHNRTTEAQGWSSLSETKRHNLAEEDIGMANVSLGFENLAENKRHNYAYETETNRHNVYGEGISSKEADISQQRADIENRKQTLAERQAAYDIMSDVYHGIGKTISSSGFGILKVLGFSSK